MKFSALFKNIVEDAQAPNIDKILGLNGKIEFKPTNAMEQSLLNSTIDWLVTFEVANFIVKTDGTIDVNGDLNLKNKKINELKLFNIVDGDVDLNGADLSSLSGFPKKVTGELIDLRNNPRLRGNDLVEYLPDIPDGFDGDVLVDERLKNYVVQKNFDDKTLFNTNSNEVKR